jgi:hypothetical protein
VTNAPHHDELPLPDYDHLPQGALESRVRTLDAAGVEALLAYEQAHGDRLPVVQVLQRRLEALRSGATPTGGDPLARTPGRVEGRAQDPGAPAERPQRRRPHQPVPAQ